MTKHKKIFGIIGIIIITISVLLFSSTREQTNKKEDKKMERIELYFGELGLEAISQYNQGQVEVHGSGISMSDLNWRPPNLGKIKIADSGVDFDIDNVFWVTTYVFDKRYGIQKINITSSFHLEEYTTPYEAYEAYVALMRQLNRKGWKQFFLPFSARIDKRDNLKSIYEKEQVIDPTYILSYEEWEDIMDKKRGMFLDLHNGGLILGIIIDKKPTGSDKKVQYMLDFSIQKKQYFNANSLGANYDQLSRLEVKEGNLQRKKQNLISRQRDEDRLKSQGFRIDENYIDDIYEYY